MQVWKLWMIWYRSDNKLDEVSRCSDSRISTMTSRCCCCCCSRQSRLGAAAVYDSRSAGLDTQPAGQRAARPGRTHGRSHVSKLWVSIFPSCPYKRPTTTVKGVDGEEWQEEIPPQPTEGLGERRNLPQRGLGRSPSCKRFWGVSCAILCDFMYFSAFYSCLEMGDFYIPLLASYSPLTFWVVGHPTWFFWGVRHPRHPQWLRHWPGRAAAAQSSWDTHAPGSSWQDPSSRSTHGRQKIITQETRRQLRGRQRQRCRDIGILAVMPAKPCWSGRRLMWDEDRSIRLVRERLQITQTDCWRPIHRSYCFIAMCTQ